MKYLVLLSFLINVNVKADQEIEKRNEVVFLEFLYCFFINWHQFCFSDNSNLYCNAKSELYGESGCSSYAFNSRSPQGPSQILPRLLWHDTRIPWQRQALHISFYLSWHSNNLIKKEPFLQILMLWTSRYMRRVLMWPILNPGVPLLRTSMAIWSPTTGDIARPNALWCLILTVALFKEDLSKEHFVAFLSVTRMWSTTCAHGWITT